jgi:hypothetical protein
MTTATAARARPAWRAVATLDEYCGWGLTAEPVLRIAGDGCRARQGCDRDPTAALGAAAVATLAGVQLVWVRRPAVEAKTLGVCQLVLGPAVVAMTRAAW